MRDFASPVPINSDHQLSVFDCGIQSLNEFLLRHALGKQNAHLSRTYVVTKNGLVVAYYTLSLVTVSQSETPKKFARGMPNEIPAMLLARLAVDRSFQGIGLGRSLFVDALRRTWTLMEQGPAPVRLFIVDAKNDEARAFYERFDMISLIENPSRLFLFYKDLRKLFVTA